MRVTGGDASGIDCSLGGMIEGDAGASMLTAFALPALPDIPGNALDGNAPGISIGVYMGVGVLGDEVSGVGSR
jgi:hypothetical protein